tara:strand:- start:42 stop:512 length:471 start_codon:yes stop_codon:yes gene_type:complete
MDRQYEIFIPFVEMETTKKFIEKILLEQNFGQIISINLNDKKIKQNGKLRSANHKYAFIKIFIFNTFPGNNLIENIRTNKTTHIMYIDNSKNMKKLDIKPYLTIKERSSKGFELHIKDFNPSFYDDVNEKLECEKDYLEIEKELNKYYTSSSLIVE